MGHYSYFKNNAAAVEEKVKIFQKRLQHQTWAGLVSSKTLHEVLSHVWVLFQVDCADPMHRLHCSSTGAVCSLREPFVTPLNRQQLPVPEVLPCLCSPALPLESSLFFTCAPFWLAISTNSFGIALGWLLSLFHFLHFSFPGQPLCTSAASALGWEPGQNYGLAVQ